MTHADSQAAPQAIITLMEYPFLYKEPKRGYPVDSIRKNMVTTSNHTVGLRLIAAPQLLQVVGLVGSASVTNRQ